MDEAIHPAMGRVPITRLSSGMAGIRELKCVGCGVHIGYTRGHWKDAGRKWIHAYLSLWPGDKHEPTCANTMDRQLDEIVARSKAATGTEVLEDDGRTISFRLHVVDDRLRSAAADVKAADADGATDNVRRQFERSSREIDAYLNTATAIARLHERLQDGGDLRAFKDRIRIEQRGRLLKWLDFCYTPERYSNLLKRVAQAKGAGFPHSIALVVDVESIEPYTPEGRPHNSGMRVNGIHYPASGPNRIRAQGFADDPATVRRAKAGMPHIIVGRPYVGGFRSGDDIGLRVKIYFPGQIAVVIETKPRTASVEP